MKMEVNNHKNSEQGKSLSKDERSMKNFIKKAIKKRKKLVLEIFGVAMFDAKMPVRTLSKLTDGKVLETEIWVLANGIIRFATFFEKGKDFVANLEESFFVEKIGIETPYCLFKLTDSLFVMKYDIALGGEEGSPQSVKLIYDDFIRSSTDLRDALMEMSDFMEDSDLFRFFSGSESFH